MLKGNRHTQAYAAWCYRLLNLIGFQSQVVSLLVAIALNLYRESTLVILQRHSLWVQTVDLILAYCYSSIAQQ